MQFHTSLSSTISISRSVLFWKYFIDVLTGEGGGVENFNDEKKMTEQTGV